MMSTELSRIERRRAVLADGAIGRVAVQRSDFRGLLMARGVPALTAGLGCNIANLNGAMAG
jgi:hypothetical protein